VAQDGQGFVALLELSVLDELLEIPGCVGILPEPIMADRQSVPRGQFPWVPGECLEKDLVFLGGQLEQPAMEQAVGSHQLFRRRIALRLLPRRRPRQNEDNHHGEPKRPIPPAKRRLGHHLGPPVGSATYE